MYGHDQNLYKVLKITSVSLGNSFLSYRSALALTLPILKGNKTPINFGKKNRKFEMQFLARLVIQQAEAALLLPLLW